MPEVTSPYEPGTPCWVDLFADDQQAALDFYRRLFGWEGEPGPAEFGGYAICSLNGKAVAGIAPKMPMDDRPPPPTVWTTYLAVGDADATQRKIIEAGGTMIAPTMTVGSVGRVGIAADPVGAVFGIWQPLDFFGAQVVGEPGAVVWNECNTSDVEASGRFYRDAIGLDHGPMADMEPYHGLTVDGRTVGGMQKIGEQFPPGTPPHWLVYFAVADVDATAATAAQAGGAVVKGPFDTPVGKMAVLRDPQGAMMMIMAPEPLTGG
ncbi:VOC family protein [Kitasatospora sp. NPDC050543]|uniref:VOC family protein n=1 Tax=Kitasatospora sp. NPDC050543 TaxID=3364054 RepID=UPI0037B6CC9C